MLWFSKDDRLREMQNLQITSKSSLKMQCLYFAKGNVKEARELYDYLSEGMENLPDFDPKPVTWVDNTKDTVSGLVSWVKDNQDTIASIVQLGRGIIGGKGVIQNVAPQTPLPPIN